MEKVLQPRGLIAFVLDHRLSFFFASLENIFILFNLAECANSSSPDETSHADSSHPDLYCVIFCFLAHRIRISACFTCAYKSYLNHVISPRAG